MGEWADYEVEKEMFGCNDYEEDYTGNAYKRRKKRHKNANSENKPFEYIEYFYIKKYQSELEIDTPFGFILETFIKKYQKKITFDRKELEMLVRQKAGAWEQRFKAFLRNIKNGKIKIN